MPKYRLLLVDPAGAYERPQQILVNRVTEGMQWMHAKLKQAGDPDKAYIQVYTTIEMQTGIYKLSDFNDQGAIAGLQSAKVEANQR